MTALEVIDHHSIDTSLLRKGPVLDVGARGFVFSRALAERGCRVVAMDPDPGIPDPGIPGVTFLRRALVGANSGIGQLVLDPNPEARYVLGHMETTRKPTVSVPCSTIADVMWDQKVSVWDAVKLNCEGEEYEILGRWPGPISRQIVVSFHEHYRPRGKAVVDRIVDRLGQWYDVVQHPYDSRYSGGMNWWDSVFALKGLARA